MYPDQCRAKVTIFSIVSKGWFGYIVWEIFWHKRYSITHIKRQARLVNACIHKFYNPVFLKQILIFFNDLCIFFTVERLIKYHPEAHSELSKTSKMELFLQIIYSQKPLRIYAKNLSLMFGRVLNSAKHWNSETH